MQEEYDFSQAKRATDIPHLNRLREQQSQSLLDEDVQNWLVKQDKTTKGYISEMIRQIMAMQNQQFVH